MPRSQLATLVPAGLDIDTFDGSAWIGILPFRLTGFRLRGLPAMPVFSKFPELNVRTYVTVGGKPGIYFLSLDAGRDWAVTAARRFYKLPYYRARMAMRGRAAIDFSSERIGDLAPPRRFHAQYRAAGEPFQAAPGTFEHFFAERYCLYTTDKARVFRAEAHHLPWSIQLAEAELDENTMVPGVQLPPERAVLHCSLRQDALIWPLRRAAAGP